MIHIGLAGWDSQSLYEAGIRSKDKLRLYSQIYDTVEVNSTYYQFPSEATIQNWHDTVPPAFRFSIKLNRLFTHDLGLRLPLEATARLIEFLTSFAQLGDKLSWFLVQLPPSLAADPAALDGFLSTMRKILRESGLSAGIAVEFRHSTWYEPGTAEILARRQATQVISSSPGRWPCEWIAPHPESYLRLHGLKRMYHTPYSKDQLNRLKEWLDDARAPAWIYFDNTATQGARDNSRYLMQILGQPVPEETHQLTMDL